MEFVPILVLLAPSTLPAAFCPIRTLLLCEVIELPAPYPMQQLFPPELSDTNVTPPKEVLALPETPALPAECPIIVLAFPSVTFKVEVVPELTKERVDPEF